MMPDRLNKFININKTDTDFLMCISDAASIDLNDLHWILSLSDSGYVEYPMDDCDYPDINDGYDEKYEWDSEGPIRISIFGRDVDYEIAETVLDVADNEVEDGRLLGLTIDFTERRVKNPKKLFSAVNFALNKFREDLALEVLSFCALKEDLLEEFEELNIRLPRLKKLIINRVKVRKINFIAAPRLEEIKIIGAIAADYDLSSILAIKEVCIGDLDLRRIILPVRNSVGRMIIGMGYLPTIREKNNGIGSSLDDLVLNMGFSVEHLSLAGCGISKVDLSIFSNLKYLNLSSNPINKLNLAWVPGLEYLDLSGTGIQIADTKELTKLKNVLIDASKLVPE
jgi:Leucine-rich repeat (LRR) protein